MPRDARSTLSSAHLIDEAATEAQVASTRRMLRDLESALEEAEALAERRAARRDRRTTSIPAGRGF